MTESSSRRCASAISIIPIMSAIPTGSLNPDSPSRIVPERPSTSLPAEDREHHRRVGRRERGADRERERPVELERRWAATARNRRWRTYRPRRARAIGAAARKRRKPMSKPPSNRIRIRASVAMRCTSKRQTRREPVGEIGGAPRRRAAAPAVGKPILLARTRTRIASEEPPPTTRTMRPKSRCRPRRDSRSFQRCARKADGR